MPSIFQRHPRYALFSAVSLLATFLLLASQHAPPPPPSFVIDSFTPSEELQHRLEYAEEVYQKMLRQREGLIQKFGPTADKVHM